MSDYEVPEPILNSPFDEPGKWWRIEEGKTPVQMDGRRPAAYFYRDPRAVKGSPATAGAAVGVSVELKLVNLVRERVASWRETGYPGVSRTTLELLQWWRRDGRERRLFFAQLEAAETIVFLKESRPDFRQGIDVPRDEPSDDRKALGVDGFTRYACKMATGAGKTTVMGMLAAWSILNKIASRADARFSDLVLIVCPNVTIRDRLQELDPKNGDASLYRKLDLVPQHLMPQLAQGRVVVTNWHVFEPQVMGVMGTSARVVKTGVPVDTTEWITIGPKTTSARGKRYLTVEEFRRQADANLLEIKGQELHADGSPKRVLVRTVRYVESDTAVVNRIFKGGGTKQNVLVMNDEAHHAYRIRREEPDEDEDDNFEDEDDADDYFREATVWVEGLDRVQKLRGINFCVDLSATPYFLGRVGQDTNRPFPWVVSDFGLVDAIESGLVKIPQLAVRDSTGSAIPGYFNIWHWILPQLTPAERGGKKANPKPEAILKYADHPIRMLGGLWDELRQEWAKGADPRPPVFILVCKNTRIAKVLFEWLAEDKAPAGIPGAKIDAFLNRDDAVNTIRVDSKVVHETDTGSGKSDESRWMRFTLDTVGKLVWPSDQQGRPIYPEGFEELAAKLKRPLHPPGRDIRCIVSVGMLTEGWDCNTVTHIVGLRPFMSQLLCEQVVGRGLRRASYELGADGKFTEEVAKVFGVPFEVVPFKANPQGAAAAATTTRRHVEALPSKAAFEIRFPRVEGYTQAIRNKITANWEKVPPLRLMPDRIPPEVEVKASLPNNLGRPSLMGPGRLDTVTLNPFRKDRRQQELVFELARALTKDIVAQGRTNLPAHVLFPQLVRLAGRFVDERVKPTPPAEKIDVFLSPYYGLAIEILTQAIQPDVAAGDAPEVPRYEANREPGSTADVSFWTSRDVREVIRSHVNYVVADTLKWEQSAAYQIDRHGAVDAFVKNAGLGFAIPYLHNGAPHDFVPDFLIRLKGTPELKFRPTYLILETKGYDPLHEVKEAAAQRWVAAVNADGQFGQWAFRMVTKVSEVTATIGELAR